MTPGAIQRQRLHSLLDVPPARLVVLQAASGYGKTTLVQTWATSLGDSDRVVLWVSLATAIDSTHSFWRRVIQVAGRSGQIDEIAAANLIADISAAENPIDPVSDLFNAIEKKIIVLDAYETIGEITPEVDADILELIRRVQDLRIIVTTRGGTSLSDAVHELRGRCLVIREDQLVFTEDETAELFATHGVENDTTVITGVLHDTRGYPLAIRAALLALTDQATPLGGRNWQTLVIQDLRSQLRDRNLVEFILDTSVPLYFDAALATELTGSPASTFLYALERDGFGRWIPWEAGTQAFQYVDAIRDAFLRSLRTSEPHRYQTAAARAATWHHAHGDHDTALDLALSAERYDIAEDIVRDSIISFPETYTTDRLVRQLQQVPRSILPAHPTLAMGLGGALLTNPALRSSAPPYFHIASEYAMAAIENPSSTEAFWRLSYQAVAHRLLGRFRQSADLVPKVIDHFDRLSPSERDQVAELSPMALRHLAYSQFQAGDVDDACATIGRAVAETPTKWARNYTLSYTAGLHALSGHRPEAEATLALIDPAAWPRDHERTFMNALGRIAQATVCLDDFRPEDALACFADNESWRDTSEFWAYLNWATGNARLLLGEAAAEAHRIEAALRATPPPLGIGQNLGTSALRGLLAILWMSVGDYRRGGALLQADGADSGQLMPARLLHLHLTGRSGEALALAHHLDELGDQTARSLAASLTIAAACALRENSLSAALSWLERAASLYANHGCRLHLAYVPAEDIEALCKLAAHSGGALTGNYLNAPLQSWRTPRDAPKPLSAREKVVLSMLVERQTRAQIASALHVSENTVKTQLASIYRKLGVTSRAQAIERAVALGLLR